ncbi:MAG TPA: glycosyltransferase [Blastocatellia bacterium]|nr:glycosyltransferase [Blastocatellia bacterium]
MTIIKGLWIGPELSAMEQLSIRSFLANGHEYHLYVYDDVANVPPGTIIKDGNEILPASMIFQYKEHKSYSAFSNFFRYKLLFERGGWWCDTDIVCLRPFDFTEEYVFSSESGPRGEVIASGVIRVPPGSQVMGYAWQICQQKDVGELRWGEVGPRLVAEAVKQLSLDRFVHSTETFCPVSYTDWQCVLDGASVPDFGDSTYAVHLWNEMWRRAGADKNATYQQSCLFEKLKMVYAARLR